MRNKTILIHILALSITLIWIIPFLSILMTAIRPMSEVSNGWWQFLIGRESFTFTIKNFIRAWNNTQAPLSNGIKNSILIAFPSTILPLTVGSIAAYGFSRFSFPIKNYIYLGIVVVISIPAQMFAVPIFQMMNTINLVNTRFSVILIQGSWNIGWAVLFLRSYFSNLPIELEESAKLDGATDFQIFRKIVIPTSKPAIISVFVLVSLWVWNGLFIPLIMIFDTSKMTAVQMIPMLKGEYAANWGLLTAASIITMSIPVIVFGILQKYYVKGMTGWTS